MSKEERTFVMLKPDAVQRGLMGEIIGRIEKSGLKVVAMKFLQVTNKLAEKHYEVHKDRPFYNSLVSVITSSPTLAMVIEGLNAVSIGRKLVGATNPADATPGTIRGDYGLDIGRNLVHASDSVENGKFESAVYFSDDEIVSWTPINYQWLYE